MCYLALQWLWRWHVLFSALCKEWQKEVSARRYLEPLASLLWLPLGGNFSPDFARTQPLPGSLCL